MTLFDSIIFWKTPYGLTTIPKKYTAVFVEDAMTGNVVVIEDTKSNDIVNYTKTNVLTCSGSSSREIVIITRNDVLKSMVKGNG